MDSTFINGKKIESPWAGSADNLKDFIKLIEDAPETLDSIKVTSSLLRLTVRHSKDLSIHQRKERLSRSLKK